MKGWAVRKEQSGENIWDTLDDGLKVITDHRC